MDLQLFSFDLTAGKQEEAIQHCEQPALHRSPAGALWMTGTVYTTVWELLLSMLLLGFEEHQLDCSV